MPLLSRLATRMPRLVMLLPVFALALGVDLVGIAMTRGAENVASIWLANGMLLAIALAAPALHRLWYLGAGLLANLAAGVLMGDPLAVGLIFVVCNGVELGIALALLGPRWQQHQLSSPIGLARFAGFAIVLAPLGGALLAGPLLSPIWNVPVLTLVSRWFVVDALGMAVMAPVCLGLRWAQVRLMFVGEERGYNLAAAGALIGVSIAVFTQASYPLLFVVFPPLMLVVIRLGFAGASVAVSVVAAGAIASAIQGIGPIGGLASLSMLERVTIAQIFVLAALCTAYPLGVMVAERRRADLAIMDRTVQLARSEQLFRVLAEHASDIVTRVRLDGKRLYVSKSVQHVLGWSVEAMMQPDWQDYVHPEDRVSLIAARDRMRAGMDRTENTYRYRRANGEWAWLEARMHLLRDSVGVPYEFVCHMRDITVQRATEERLAEAHATMAELAATDGLTGLANRRHFDEMLEREWRRALRARGPIALLMVDADHFKRFNDTYGHPAGDDALRAVASAVAGPIRRPGDLPARYGGEEFAVILPGTTLGGAMAIAEQIRANLAARNIVHSASPIGRLSLSIGVASLVPAAHLSIADLIAAADAALYEAKRLGRDQAASFVASPEDSNVVVLTASAVPLAG